MVQVCPQCQGALLPHQSRGSCPRWPALLSRVPHNAWGKAASPHPHPPGALQPRQLPALWVAHPLQGPVTTSPAEPGGQPGSKS